MKNTFTKMILALALICSATAPAFADWNDYHRTRGYYYGHGYGPGVIVEPAPIYVAPQPVYVGPPPVVVAPPPPPVMVYNPAQPYVRVRCTNNAITGTIIGGVAGGLIGTQFGHGRHRGVPIVGGTIIGALIGDEIGRSDEVCAAQALEYAKPNTQVVWTDGGQQYAVEPVKTFQQNGQYCREYQTRVSVGGQVQQGYGTACRQPDGSWQIEN